MDGRIFRGIRAGLLVLLLASGAAVRATSTDAAGETATSDAVLVAQPTDPDAQPPEAPSPDVQMPAKKKWEFATIGYIFFAGAHGKTTPRDPFAPVTLDLSFHDVLKAFKFAFMGAAEARNDRLVFLGDLMWVHLGESQGLKIRDVNFADVKIDSKTTAITALGGYRVANKGPVVVDLMAGGRLNGNKQRVDYHGTLIDVSPPSRRPGSILSSPRASSPLSEASSARPYMATSAASRSAPSSPGKALRPPITRSTTR